MKKTLLIIAIILQQFGAFSQCPPSPVYYKYTEFISASGITNTSPSTLVSILSSPDGCPWDQVNAEHYTQIEFYSDVACTIPVNVTLSYSTTDILYGTVTYNVINNSKDTFYVPESVREFDKVQFGYCSDAGVNQTIPESVRTFSCSNVYAQPDCTPFSKVTLANKITTCQPDSIILTTQAVASSFSYTWTDGTNYLPTTNINPLVLNNPGTTSLFCQIFDTVTGCKFNTNPIVTTINPQPSPIIIPTYNGTISINMCSNESAPGTTYLWNTGATTQCITATSNGDYYCAITSAAGCFKASDTIKVTGLAILPVIISSFNGQQQNEMNKLSWKLDSKEDFIEQQIESSIDGKNFVTIFKSKDINIENFSHTTNNTQYYRLRIINRDGQPTLSKIIKVIGQNKDNLFYLKSNIVTSEIELISLSKNQNLYNIKIINSTGALVYNGSISSNKSNIINSNSLPVGAYYLNICNNEQNTTLRFFKAK